MAQVGVTLFGGVQVRLPSGQATAVPGRNAPALLGYLGVHAGQAHSRDKLAALLWPEAPAERARHSLRQTLVTLRQALPAGVLVEVGDTIALAGTAAVDVGDFERAVAAGTPDGLARAADLYQGDLLAGLGSQGAAFEDWLLSERERLREIALEALAKLLAHRLQAGAAEAAIPIAVRLLGLDPAQEAVHRTLMRLYARQGRPGAALRQYQACVSALERELGAPPEAETRRLYEEILTARASRAEPAVPREAMPTPPPAPAVAPETPLVGRAGEWTALREAREAAWQGRGRLLVLLGEAGIGKTRLAAELVADAVEHGGGVLVGRAYETAQTLALGPWVDAVRSGGVLGALAADVQAPWQAELGRLFPEMGGSESSGPAGPEDQGRLFEAMAQALVHLAKQRPFLLVLEDLHWSDETSLRLLSFLGRRLPDWRGLLVVTAREEELDGAPLLRSVLQELDREHRASIVRLGALSRPDTVALVQALTRTGTDAALVARLGGQVWQASEGNPFVVVETMRAVHEGEAVPAGAGLPLPQRVRDTIAGRLDRLSARGRQLGALAAVVGREFDFGVLQHAAGLEPGETAEGVEELVQRRVLHVVGDRLDLTHERIRDVAYARLLPEARRLLHARVAAALEAAHAGDLESHYAALAAHYRTAEDWSRAIDYLIRLAGRAARAFAHADAVAALQEASGHLARLSPEAQDARALDIAPLLARSLAFLGRRDEAADVLERQEAPLARVRDARHRGRSLLLRANTFSYLGDRARTADSARRAIDEATRSGDESTVSKALYVLAMEGFRSGQLRQGAEQAREAIAVLGRAGEPLWLGHAHWVSGGNHLLLGELDRAEAAFRVARDVAEAIGAPRLAIQATWSLGIVHAMRGHHDAGIDACQQALDRAPDPLNAALALGWQGFACLEKGDTDGALARLSRSVEALGRVGHRQGQSWMTSFLGDAHLGAGQLDEAERLAREGLELTRSAGYGCGVGVAQEALGRILWARGDLAAASAVLDDALQTFTACDASYYAGRTRLTLARLAGVRRDAGEAAIQLVEAHRLFSSLGIPLYVERARALATELGVAVARG
jgi:DNA-binding SARP family transcriptional activator